MNADRGVLWIPVILVAFVTISSGVYARETAAPRVIHVFVALCDNVHQGIVPVPAALGNGDDPGKNLYWGARYGIKTFLSRSPRWTLLETIPHLPTAPDPDWRAWPFRFRLPEPPILERCVFRHAARRDVYLVADAYRGRRIKQAVIDFLNAASGATFGGAAGWMDGCDVSLPLYGDAQLLVYVGHDGLMDFSLNDYPVHRDRRRRDAMILACFSRRYFSEPVKRAGAHPLLWTTGLMAPEAYTLAGALEGWIAGEAPGQIRLRAAAAYHKYQRCGLNAAGRLLVTGFRQAGKPEPGAAPPGG